MPDHSRRVGQRGDLIDDDTPSRLVTIGRVPGRAEHRVQRGRRAALDGQRQLGDQLPLAGLLRRRPLPGHHVVRGDRLEQRAFEQLPARYHEVGVMAAERGGTRHGAGSVLGGLAEAADELAGQVLSRGECRGAAVEAEPPAVQPHELGEDRLELGRGDAPFRRAVMGEGDGGDTDPFGMIA
jgi:hypothetical protein